MAIDLSPQENSIYRIVAAIRQLIEGRSNTVGRVTLTAGATFTVVTKNIHEAAVNTGNDSEVFLTPRTANAAAALATTYISNVGRGTFTITHANNAQVDRTFGFIVIG